MSALKAAEMALQSAALAGSRSICLAEGCRLWARVLGVDRAWLATCDAAQWLEGATAIGADEQAVRATRRPLSDAPTTRAALAADRAVFRTDPGEWHALSGGPLLVAGLVGPEGPMGVLVAEWPGREPRPEILELASAVARTVALGLATANRLAAQDGMMEALAARVYELETQAERWRRDRRRAEETSELLRRATARLHAVIDRMPQGLLIVGVPNGAPLLANPAASALLGLGGPDPGAYRLLASDGSACEPGALPVDIALRSGAGPPQEMLAESADGRRVSLLVSAVPLPDQNGRVAEALVILQDITSLKEIDRLKSEIIALVSHELRTPLHHVKGFVSTLLTPQLSLDEATRQDLLESIEQETNRLVLMVTDLLDIARIEAGAVEKAEKVPTDPADLLRGGIRRAEALIPGRSVHAVVHGAPAPVPVDRGRIERVLVNLLGNAAKFSPPGCPIEVVAEDTAGELTVRVIDHGRGIAPEERERVFERFYRGPGVASGTGLGLSICRTIIEAHGGRIWVEETWGGGATVAFSLPRAGVGVEAP